MKHETEERVVALLRESALNGSDREVRLDDPLGETGVGLDSLALVQFLSAIEGAYKIRIPVEFWARADQACLNECIDMILAAARDT